MTKENYKQELRHLNAQMKKDYEEYEKQGNFVGLDNSPIDKKYKKLQKELFEKYQREKED